MKSRLRRSGFNCVRSPALRNYLMAHPAVMESFDRFQLAGLGDVRGGLADSSWRVREKASDWASRCGFVELLPELRKARLQERNESVRECLEYSISQLVREQSARNKKAMRRRVAV